MTLDITKITPQITDMVAKIKSGNQQYQEHLKCAVDKLCDKSLNIEKLKRKIIQGRGKTTWLVAGLTDDLSACYKAPDLPDNYTVIATDGSHIEIDRNKSAHCFVINVGAVLLTYGPQPKAILESYPRLYCDEEEMEIVDENDKKNKRAIDSTLLGIKRGVEECHKLVELATTLPKGSKSLALMDGTLILWGLEAYPDFISDTILKKEYLACLDIMRKLNGDKDVALASYISLPRSSEVVNTLRIAICPKDVPNCDQCQEINNLHPCDAVSGIQDYVLFTRLLDQGERSSLFYSQSSVVNDYYEQNRVYFFYLRVEDEIARVEVPEWIAMKPDLLNLTHALILDQCRRGQGYPVALSEAHEKAVVTGADREEFWSLVEELLTQEKIPTINSTKSRSKRTRWI